MVCVTVILARLKCEMTETPTEIENLVKGIIRPKMKSMSGLLNLTFFQASKQRERYLEKC